MEAKLLINDEDFKNRINKHKDVFKIMKIDVVYLKE